MASPSKIVVTGFDAFGDHTVNPSALVAQVNTFPEGEENIREDEHETLTDLGRMVTEDKG